jgi:hypothetical protein
VVFCSLKWKGTFFPSLIYALRTKDGSNACPLSVSFHVSGGLENDFAVSVVRIVCSLVTILYAEGD